eukprot:CAMPEP_0182476978 /NCGR_PEP_ID=MMETSP1319-20130603/30129_1 /TAXON_ID=172717 /ORGANISM="Bolidomonas pacifica, Strain RCC208" /LENGTH=159 /DNA_ID=CAMNT_0024678129 /DNA_START=47 /DNA_END=527 /DNA_ORIENTATION=-
MTCTLSTSQHKGTVFVLASDPAYALHIVESRLLVEGYRLGIVVVDLEADCLYCLVVGLDERLQFLHEPRPYAPPPVILANHHVLDVDVVGKDATRRAELEIDAADDVVPVPAHDAPVPLGLAVGGVVSPEREAALHPAGEVLHQPFFGFGQCHDIDPLA